MSLRQTKSVGEVKRFLFVCFLAYLFLVCVYCFVLVLIFSFVGDALRVKVKNGQTGE